MANKGTGLVKNLGGNIDRAQVKSAVDSYEKYHTYHGGEESKRKASYSDMVNKYYDLATSFYEYGWGESFHFGHRLKGETLRESLKRHEHFLALWMGLRPGMEVLDVGCGVGGPLREIASFSGAHVTGLNNNSYQIARGEELNRKGGHNKTCKFMKADFMNIPAPSNTYDGVYEIEATCHAPDAVACYKEILRVLKPGQVFAGYEWCMTDAFDSSNPEHLKCKAEIELGNGLPEIRTVSEIRAALEISGFEILKDEDLTLTAEVPWYQPLDPNYFSISQFRLTLVGRTITRLMVWFLERMGIAPEGTYKVAQFLEKGADGLVDGGRKELFTPMYFFAARKPQSN